MPMLSSWMQLLYVERYRGNEKKVCAGYVSVKLAVVIACISMGSSAMTEEQTFMSITPTDCPWHNCGPCLFPQASTYACQRKRASVRYCGRPDGRGKYPDRLFLLDCSPSAEIREGQFPLQRGRLRNSPNRRTRADSSRAIMHLAPTLVDYRTATIGDTQ